MFVADKCKYCIIKKTIALLLIIVQVLLFCSCNTEQSEFYSLVKKYRANYGYINSLTINNGYDETDENELAELLRNAQLIMKATGEDRQNLDSDDKLYEYVNSDAVAEVKGFSIRIESAHTSGNSGYVWVVYSGEWIDKEGFIIKNRKDELAYWEIKKENDKWIVVDTVNLP